MLSHPLQHDSNHLFGTRSGWQTNPAWRFPLTIDPRISFFYSADESNAEPSEDRFIIGNRLLVKMLFSRLTHS